MEIQQPTEQRAMAESPFAKSGFWQRQFAATVTRPQIIFDVIVGVLGPVLCFVFDPIVFRGWLMGPPLLGDYQTFVYLFSGLQITLLSFWLLTGPGLKPWNRLMGGMLLSGTVFCVIIGFVLAPFSLIGLIYGVGVFGLTPFLTALVYLRNSRRAWRAENNGAESFAAALIGVSGILLVSGLPLFLSIQIKLTVSRAVTEIIEGDSQHAMFAAQRLMPLRFFADAELDQIVNAYTFAKNEQRKELLKSCYREITGDSIENRAPILRD